MLTGDQPLAQSASMDGTKTGKLCCTPHVERSPVATAATEFASSSAPERPDVVELPGGSFLMGTDSDVAFEADGEGPVREVTLSPFLIDRHTVTNAKFARFVEQTGYTTEAERFGWSFVFWSQIEPSRFRAVVTDTVAAAPWWCQVPGATWRAPAGPGSSVTGRADHPVVQVSWNDAAAYASWAGQRLPTEAEWEYAARGGLVQKLYPWGDKLRPAGQHRCNIWQGEFPRVNSAEDGYAETCPVEAFPPNGFGLYSMTGNTWEWCHDWFSSDYHVAGPRNNPQGPPTGVARVMKGGSFLCHKSYCNRYRVAARSSNTPDSCSSHMSFRCASDF